MGYTIAMAGKGGTGKTTIAGLVIKYMLEKGLEPILAVDADPNANLNEVLGLEVTTTLGDAREEMKKGVQTGMTKEMFMEMKVEEALVEADGFDLLVMGRPEGPGCYCAANHLLSMYLERLTKNYPYLVIDNEAGMEHLSRLTTREVDLMLMISDSSKRGITAAARINELVESLPIHVSKKYLIVNQVRNGLPEPTRKEIERVGLKLAGVLPANDDIMNYDAEGKPIIDLPEDNPMVKSTFEVLDKIIEIPH